MTRVAIILPARQSSSRVPDKMLRPFAGTTLFDIALRKLEELDVPAYVAAYEPVFLDAAKRRGVGTIERTRASACAEGPTNVLGFLGDISEEWVVLVNACCPFLRVGTILKALDIITARSSDPQFHGVTTVQEIRRWVWTDRGIIVNADPQVATTQSMQPLLLASHGLYAFRPSYFFEHGRYWQFREGSPSLIVVDSLESIDIDTMTDFRMAGAIHRGLR